MKKIYFTFVLLYFIHTHLLSQSGWFWQNPLPQGNHLINVSFTGSNIVYISGDGGTLLKSTNGGNNFELLQTNTTENLNVNFINELTGFSPGWNGGILRTTTGGTSWEYFQVLLGCTVIQITFLNNSTGFVLLQGINISYIYKSTNLGNTWSLSLGNSSNIGLNTIQFIDENTGYAAGRKNSEIRSKFFRTINGGANWDSIASDIQGNIWSVYFNNIATGYAVMYGSPKILKTTNSCLSWDTVRQGNFFQLLKINFFNELSGYASGYENMLTTTNAGLNWVSTMTMKFIFMKDFINGIALGTAPQFNLIYKTTNSGAGWELVSHGFIDLLWDVDFINENTGFSGYYKRIYKTTNGGSNWFDDSLKFNCQGFCNVESIDFVNESIGYAAIGGGFFAKTTNSGVNWIVRKTGIEDNNYGISFPSKDTGYIVTQYRKYLKTTNGGDNWVFLGQSINEYFRVRFADNNTGVAIGMPNSEQYGAYSVTTNGGLIWTEHNFDSLRFYPNDLRLKSNAEWFFAGYNYTGTYNGVLVRTTNMGNDWDYKFFPNTLLGSIDFSSNLTGYASGDKGIMYKTSDGGLNWFPTYCISNDYLNGIYFVNDLTGYAVGGSGQIIKTTTGGGAPIGIQSVTNVVPKSFLLYQNYPNPFNPVTTIQFLIPAPSPLERAGVRLVIYDLLGREAAVLVNEQLPPGTYEVEWNASNFSSGVYFYKLEAGDFLVTKKMVLLK